MRVFRSRKNLNDIKTLANQTLKFLEGLGSRMKQMHTEARNYIEHVGQEVRLIDQAAQNGHHIPNVTPVIVAALKV